VRGRKRTTGANLPSGVQTVRAANGRMYYYWAPRKGTAAAGHRVALGNNTRDPDFWKRLQRAMAVSEGAQQGTFQALIDEYKASPEWDWLRPATRRNYDYNFTVLLRVAANVAVADIKRRDIYALRDAVADRPATANKLVSVLHTILKWSIKREYRDDDPTLGVEKLDMDVDGTRPWPDRIYDYVIRHAPENLRRMAVLGRATGQREADLKDMSPAHLERDGINLLISKRRDKAHFVPLTRAQMIEIRSWGVDGLNLFLKTTRGKPFTEGALRSHWKRWKAEHPELAGSNIKITIHGLKATKVCDMRLAGVSDGSIADEVGMSVGMVARYARNADKAAAARASRDRREGAEIVRLADHKGGK